MSARKPPSPRTLAGYGMTPAEWLAVVDRQGNRCPICLRHDVELVTDHVHIRGFRKLPADQRRRYVRGCPCRHCNLRLIPQRGTADEIQRVAEYLRAHEQRFDGPAPTNDNRFPPCGDCTVVVTPCSRCRA